MKTALFTSFMAALVLVPAAGAQLECSVVNSACAVGYTDFLHMFSNEDSHAELPSGTDYGWSLCCRGIPGLNNIRQGDPGTDYDVFLRLNLPTNSHVERL